MTETQAKKIDHDAKVRTAWASLALSPEFQTVFTDLQIRFGFLAPSFSAQDNFNPTAAAVRDGEKNVLRHIAKKLSISEKTNDYAEKVVAALRAAYVRVGLDAGNDRIQAKVKVAADEKIPYMLIVGPRDAESNSVSVRMRGTEKDLGAMPLDAFVAAIKAEIAERKAELGVKP